LFAKEKNTFKTKACVIKESVLNKLSDYFNQNANFISFSSKDSWVILSPIEQQIKSKIEKIGIPLKDWDVQINYGIKTGYNDAFIISGSKKDEILANCKTEEERKKTAEIIRPILRGRDIKRYGYDFADL
ncbi:Eco57I restriction-modification methylase domain-containing protein, partial [Ornithobacterium rhinotracheale]